MRHELRTLLDLLGRYEHLSARTLILTMSVAIGCGLFIYVLYRFFYRGVIYSENFGLLLVMVSGTTAFIIVTIGANLVLSLGMVGALSIVRFRAAIKEPLDVGFLFLAIAAGLTSGARLYPVAIIGTLIIGVVYIGMTYLRMDKRNFLLIVRFDAAHDSVVLELLKSIKYKLKNRTVIGTSVELTSEVVVKRNNTEFLETFQKSKVVESVVLVEYNGDYI